MGDVGHADRGGKRLGERPQGGERFPFIQTRAENVVVLLHRLKGELSTSRVATKRRLVGLLAGMRRALASRGACLAGALRGSRPGERGRGLSRVRGCWRGGRAQGTARCGNE